MSSLHTSPGYRHPRRSTDGPHRRQSRTSPGTRPATTMRVPVPPASAPQSISSARSENVVVGPVSGSTSGSVQHPTSSDASTCTGATHGPGWAGTVHDAQGPVAWAGVDITRRARGRSPCSANIWRQRSYSKIRNRSRTRPVPFSASRRSVSRWMPPGLIMIPGMAAAAAAATAEGHGTARTMLLPDTLITALPTCMPVCMYRKVVTASVKGAPWSGRAA